MKKLLLLFVLALGFSSLSAQVKDPAFVQYMHSPWVDSVYKSMSLKDQIGQMIFVELRPSNPSTVVKAMQDVQNLKVGGAVLFLSKLPDQAAIVNSLQKEAKTPLLIAIDGEWGLGMRLQDVDNFPYQMALGSLKDNELIYKMGLEVARQAKRAGLHINLAPTIDVNNNSLNPVIGYRSFGEDPKDVAAKGLAYMKGMEDGGIICTAKHYPGHGDTEVDDHHSVEDVAIALGETFKKALGDRKGIERFADCVVPMDETAAQVAVDLSGRGYLVFDCPDLSDGKCGAFDLELVEEFLRAFCYRGGVNAYVKILKGGNRHHEAEAVFKALARCLKKAVAVTSARIPSSKGVLE